MTVTADFAPYLTAAVASLRRHNSETPVRVLADPQAAELLREVAVPLAIEVVPTGPAGRRNGSPQHPQEQLIQSRLAKITGLVESPFDPTLYLDSDTILQDDIGKIVAELAPALDSGHDLMLLLRRPTAPTLWGDRLLYFKDPSIQRPDAVRLLNDVFGIELTVDSLDELVCWNSGIIYGRTRALRVVGRRWLDLYRRAFDPRWRDVLIARDQLPFWVTLWELRDRISVGELPHRWNFMAGQMLGLPKGLPELPADERLDRAAVLHLAGWKTERWAVERVSALLSAVPGAPALDSEAGAVRNSI
ncbi:hypothetical protein [Micromonospora sp. NPDC049240]|uniref:hypothetical protein n=1 Tax=Micromonospora sp. NPDC049240 TaxID=3155151 RepID=UPI0033CBE121